MAKGGMNWLTEKTSTKGSEITHRRIGFYSEDDEAINRIDDELRRIGIRRADITNIVRFALITYGKKLTDAQKLEEWDVITSRTARGAKPKNNIGDSVLSGT